MAELHFVYNVELKLKPLLAEAALKLRDADAETDCRLCDLTWGRFVKNPDWTTFLKHLPVSASFYTRDKFTKHYPDLAGHEYPAVFLEQDGVFSLFLSRDDFSRIATLDELKQVILEKLASDR